MTPERHNDDAKPFPEGEDVGESRFFSRIVENFSKTFGENDMKSFYAFLEDPNTQKKYDFDAHIDGIQYAYATDFQLHQKNKETGVYKQVYPVDYGVLTTKAEYKAIFSEETIQMMQYLDVYVELLNRDDILKAQYDLLAGHYPGEGKDNPGDPYEMVIILDKYNKISDHVLYGLGLADPSEMLTILENEKLRQENPDKNDDEIEGIQPVDPYKGTFSDLIGLKYKMPLNIEAFKEDKTVPLDDPATEDFDESTYVDNPATPEVDESVPIDDPETPDVDESKRVVRYHYRYDKDLFDAAIENAPTVRISGIIRPKADAAATFVAGGVGYSEALTKDLIRRVNDREAIKQLHDEDDQYLPFNFDDICQRIPALGYRFKMLKDLLIKTSGDMITEDNISNALANRALSWEELADPIRLLTVILQDILGMPADTIEGLIITAIGEANIDTFKKNFSFKREDVVQQIDMIFGVCDESNPRSIMIYPHSFEDKDAVVEMIKEYNNSASLTDPAKKITFTDSVGALMSSVTVIVNSITYVLIAFVSISLIVSSIMIGIITYVSVIERTKEIGILRSLGASKGDVANVFNAETMMIGFAAGLIGIIVTGILILPINAIIASLTGITSIAHLKWYWGLTLIIVSIVLTLIAGLIPSGIAAKRDPVIALRTGE